MDSGQSPWPVAGIRGAYADSVQQLRPHQKFSLQRKAHQQPCPGGLGQLRSCSVLPGLLRNLGEAQRNGPAYGQRCKYGICHAKLVYWPPPLKRAPLPCFRWEEGLLFSGFGRILNLNNGEPVSDVAIFRWRMPEDLFIHLQRSSVVCIYIAANKLRLDEIRQGKKFG